MPTNFTALTDGQAVSATVLNSPLQELDDEIEDVKDGTSSQSAPAITSFANSTHDHTNAAGGGQITMAAVDTSAASGSGEVWQSDGAGGGSYTPLGATVGARAYNNSNISVNSSSATALTFNSERYDTDTIHSTATNTGRLTAQTAGKYMIYGHVELESTSSTAYIAIRLNGTTEIARVAVPAGASAKTIYMSISTIYDLSAADYVELLIWHVHGSARNVVASANRSPEFGMQMF